MYLLATSLAVGGASLAWHIRSVAKVRYDRVRSLDVQYAHLLDNLGAMTYQEANEIIKVTHFWDFPWTAALSLSFALFKTHAIPTISKVLNNTGELGSAANAGRRAEDTALFIGEYMTEGLDSRRGSISIARTNYLHSRYGSAIKQEDLLFTLALFIFEPIVLIEKYEWRALTPLERQARFVFWREIGARMGIQNLPETSEELWDWKEAYADRAMVFNEENAKTGEFTLAVLLKPFPTLLKGLARQAAMPLIDNRTRQAFGWERAPAIYYYIVPLLFRLRALFIRYLMYPRTRRPPVFSTQEHPDGSMMREGFYFEPWYVPPGSSSIGCFGIGKPVGGSWRPETLGPQALQDKGAEWVLTEAEAMRKAAGTCPFYRP